MFESHFGSLEINLIIIQLISERRGQQFGLSSRCSAERLIISYHKLIAALSQKLSAAQREGSNGFMIWNYQPLKHNRVFAQLISWIIMSFSPSWSRDKEITALQISLGTKRSAGRFLKSSYRSYKFFSWILQQKWVPFSFRDFFKSHAMELVMDFLLLFKELLGLLVVGI